MLHRVRLRTAGAVTGVPLMIAAGARPAMLGGLRSRSAMINYSDCREEDTMKKKLLTCSALLLLASCSSYNAPYSLLGATKTNLNANTFNIGIERVDGSSPMDSPIKLAPGMHKVEVSASGLSNVVTTVNLDLKPCVQYWIVGERFDPVGNIIKVKIDRTEPIPYCDAMAKK
jgi:hypothetical protein